MSVSHYNNIEELPAHIVEQIHRFFEDYKKMEKKEVKVLEFGGREKAYEIIRESIELYKTTYGEEANWFKLLNHNTIIYYFMINSELNFAIKYMDF